MREAIPLPSLPAPRFRYSPCIKVGPYYHLAGMIAMDKRTGSLVAGGPENETRQILKNLLSALGDLHLSLDHLVSANIFTTRFEEFPAINKAWEEVFTDKVTPPARTSIGVAALPLNATVEIEFRLFAD